MTDPKTFQKLDKLTDFGISTKFIEFITQQLINNPSLETKVLDYCAEVKERYQNKKVAKPRHLFSSVSSRRSNRHGQFWYK